MQWPSTPMKPKDCVENPLVGPSPERLKGQKINVRWVRRAGVLRTTGLPSMYSPFFLLTELQLYCRWSRPRKTAVISQLLVQFGLGTWQVWQMRDKQKPLSGVSRNTHERGCFNCPSLFLALHPLPLLPAWNADVPAGAPAAILRASRWGSLPSRRQSSNLGPWVPSDSGKPTHLEALDFPHLTSVSHKSTKPYLVGGTAFSLTCNWA